MHRISLIPIYRRTYIQNESEKQKYVKNKIQPNQSKNYIDSIYTSSEQLYRYGFNQVCGFIEIYIDNLFHLKIVKHKHNGHVVLGGKYNFEDIQTLFNKSILELKTLNIIKVAQDIIDQSTENKLHVEKDYINNIELSEELTLLLKEYIEESRDCKSYDNFVKCKFFLSIDLGHIIDTSKYDYFLKRELNKEHPALFPFVSYLENVNSDVLKLVADDFGKNTSLFQDYPRQDLINLDLEKIKHYCSTMKLDYNLIQALKIPEQVKFVYSHYYNLLIREKIIKEVC